MEESILEVVHETAVGFHETGLMAVETLQEFETLCLPALKRYTPEEIRLLRVTHDLSQVAFAAYLNLSPSTIQKWERGLTTPQGASLKLLNIVERRGIEILT